MAVTSVSTFIISALAKLAWWFAAVSETWQTYMDLVVRP
jgi:hypothetical protein